MTQNLPKLTKSSNIARTQSVKSFPKVVKKIPNNVKKFPKNLKKFLKVL